MTTIKILGSGCPNCKRLEQLARKAAEKIELEAEFIKVIDYQEIMDYGILSTPGLVVNGEVVSSGRVPSEAEIVALLTDALKS